MVFIAPTTYDGPESAHFADFPFELSPFQKHAIDGIVGGRNVLITAHTGSGKTLPAEFAIRYFGARGKKVLYLSPIKALSNQKFYDFTRKFPDRSVGLLTGDIKIAVLGDVLVMTTEILLNYLVHGRAAGGDFQIDIAAEVGAIVFDEIHYINDEGRGRAYEQTLLLLPPHIQLIMLSATLESPEKFAGWIEARGGPEVVLCNTNHRVVPLTHYCFVTTTETFYKTKCKTDKTLEKTVRGATNKFLPIQTAAGEFVADTYRRVAELARLAPERVARQHVLNQCARQLRDADMLPAICFVFSRRNTEQYAAEITTNLLEDDSKIPYMAARECEAILRRHLPNYAEYLALAEYRALVALLEKGIAYHHSGMLPILREIVEFMILEKKIKLLFATESFAIGLDCPIKTAVFSALEKYDGCDHRLLAAHEYSQMAGRAGRRGMDTVGHVVHLNNMFDLPAQTDYRIMLGGKPQTLMSKFHVGYSLVYSGNAAAVAARTMAAAEIAAARDAAAAEIAAACAPPAPTTPMEVCIHFMELSAARATAVNKRRREIEKQMAAAEAEWPRLRQDLPAAEALQKHNNTIKKLRDNAREMEFFMDNQIAAATEILAARGFLEGPRAAAAAKLGEIHGPIMMELLEEIDYFVDYSTAELVGLLAAFADTSIPAEDRAVAPPDRRAGRAARRLREKHDEWEAMETARGYNSGFDYYNAISYDAIDVAAEWAASVTDAATAAAFVKCLTFSVGDFVKGMLKVSNIARELGVILIETQPAAAAKLAEIDGAILKYIVTMQSLYL